jgi:alkylation response protein AidB-like acyl-CoA dehydrogenase
MRKFVSERNLKFLLYEVLEAESLTQYEYFQEHNRETFDMVVETALKMGRDMLLPHLKEMDQIPPTMVNGEVKVHPIVKTYMTECGEGGWIAANAPFELGGQQLPTIITNSCLFIFGAANYSASVYPMLTTGAAHLIEAFGSSELIETFVPKMFAGQWQGTMALTEPQAGSSLAEITTQAEPTAAGYYKIRGQKIFISASDHDGVENIVHLMLARIQGAPHGVKGISLFVVPKLRPDGQGGLTPNDVTVAGLYHKLGYRGAPIAQLSMGENDDCRGYLVGEPHKGLSYMFQMMNEARIGVGVGAAGIASAAYYAALQYTRERQQGRKLTEKDPAKPAVLIIEHPDVKRMLLFQRSVVEGGLSLLLQCSKYADLARAAEGEESEKYALLLDVLVPVAKTYPSEMGILAASQALQCLGGYGYCDEFPVEQFYRDARIHPIHEGTTGIQGLDLLGRKVVMKNGAGFRLFVAEVQNATQAAVEYPDLRNYAERLEAALNSLQEVTSVLAQIGRQGDTEIFLADATLYLELFGLISVGWQWLLQATAATSKLEGPLPEQDVQFYKGKIFTSKYFFHYELPKIEGLVKRLLEADGLTVQMKDSLFWD